jgi:hypothetical protein
MDTIQTSLTSFINPMTTESLQQTFCPFGYMDIQWIVDLINDNEFPLRDDDIYEIICDQESIGITIDDIDPCGAILEYVLRESSLTEDIKYDSTLEVFHNYLDSSLNMRSEIAQQIQDFYTKNPPQNKYDEYILERSKEF